jgi:protease YdgD
VAGQHHCSAVLIADNLALSAAHCLYSSRQGNWIKGQFIHFVGGYQFDQYKAHSQVLNYYIPPQYRPKSRTNQQNTPYDWALLSLKAPIGKKLGYMPLARFNAQQLANLSLTNQFIQVGYGQHRPYILSADFNCKAHRFKQDNRLIMHQCQSARGDSGGPLLVKRQNRLELVAIHSGRIKQVKGSYGVAIPSQQFYDKVRLINKNPTLH